MMPSLLVVFAHPDDEFGVSGVLAKHVAIGARVTLACATRGEVGEISDPSLATPDTLGAVREAELRAACAVLGVHDVRFLGYRDSGMKGTPENDDPRSYHRADPEAATRQLVALIREVKPQVVVTFEPGGGYGHPDHVAASRYTTAAFDLAGEHSAFPGAGPAWRPQRLFHAVVPRSVFVEMRDRLRAMGVDTSAIDSFDIEQVEPVDDQVTHVVDISAQMDAKIAAFNCHRTQFGPEHVFRRLPEDAVHEMLSREYFIQARPLLRPSPGAPMLNDLFAGLA